jgi:hypothetical protein
MARAIGRHHQPLGPNRSGLMELPHRGHTDIAVPGATANNAGTCRRRAAASESSPCQRRSPDRSTTPSTGGRIEAATCRATTPPAEAPTRVIRPASWARAQVTAAMVVASHWSAGLPGGHWEAPAPHWLNSSDRTPLVLASQSA